MTRARIARGPVHYLAALAALALCVSSPAGCTRGNQQAAVYAASPRAMDCAGRTDVPLTLLLAAHAGLQAADYYTTRRALSRGAHETNPIMRPLLNHEPAAIALKVGVTLLWTSTMKHTARNTPGGRAAALFLTAAAVGAYSFVAVHNTRVAGRLAK